MAESPDGRPVAADLIEETLDAWTWNNRKGFCGFTRGMAVYSALREAGFLNEDAMVPNNANLCCGRTSIWEPCEAQQGE